MTIRSLDLFDLPKIYRLRGEAVSLDTARTLTRGNPLGASGLLAFMNPQRHVYSAISLNDGVALLGGVIQNHGDTFARLWYLAPAAQMEHPDLAGLIENLTAESASWGAFHVLAELDEDRPLFETLRRAGFAAYARQRMWDVSDLRESQDTVGWPRARSVDVPAIQSLYHQIVPALLQPIEPAPRRATGFICNQGGPCYADTSTGLNGVVIFPLIHPDATDVPNKLRALIHGLPNRGGRPVYVCVRTYQSWLERVLEDLGARAGPPQAVMVKHMTRLLKEEQAVRARQPAGVTVQTTRLSHFDNHSRDES